MRPLLRPVLLVAGSTALAVLFTLAATGLLGGTGPAGPAPATTEGRTSRGLDPAALRDGRDPIRTLQDRLRTTPKDHRSWSNLALAYVEQARVTADPSFYAKADEALARAGALAPGDSVLLTAQAALDTARHDFPAALAAAREALARNPYSAAAQALRSDALTELGRYGPALAAAQRADDLDPGPSTFARLSYQAELRGDLAEATRLMRLSQEAASTNAAAYAFATYHLGELARTSGRSGRAAHHYRNALDADPTYLQARAGLARLAVARGDLEAAERDYLRVVQRLPLTEYVVELGELYQATGRETLADQQYAVAAASGRLLAANGVATDLETALFEADHGSPVAALAAARAEWDRRQSVHTADALGWALHARGDDRAALRYVREANRLGTRDPRLVFHLGAVEAGLGLPSAATTLRTARALDAGASLYREAQIDALLGGLR